MLPFEKYCNLSIYLLVILSQFIMYTIQEFNKQHRENYIVTTHKIILSITFTRTKYRN